MPAWARSSRDLADEIVTEYDVPRDWVVELGERIVAEVADVLIEMVDDLEARADISTCARNPLREQ